MSTWHQGGKKAIQTLPCSYFRKFPFTTREGVLFFSLKVKLFREISVYAIVFNGIPESEKRKTSDAWDVLEVGSLQRDGAQIYWMSLQFVQSLVISRRSGIASLSLYLKFFFFSFTARTGEGIEQLNLHTWVCVCVWDWVVQTNSFARHTHLKPWDFNQY